jgi:hypothetical protein
MAMRVGPSSNVPPPGAASAPEAPKSDAPAPPDAFNGKPAPSLALLAQGKVPLRTPLQLASNLSRLSQAAEVPQRFASDLAVAKPDLVEHPSVLLREDKAQRLFDFAVPYAQKALELKAPPEVLTQLVKQAELAGFNQLRSGDKNGTEALRELLKVPPDKLGEVASAMKFDAPTWPQVPQPIVPRREADEARNENPADERTTNKTLGRNTLWNVLHLFRSDGFDDRESAKQREEKNQLALIAALVLVFITIIVVVLATL